MENENNYNYDIYIKNKRIYHSLSENEFKNTWKMLNNMLSIFGNADKNDLNYKKNSKSKLSMDWQSLYNTVWYWNRIINLWQKDLL